MSHKTRNTYHIMSIRTLCTQCTHTKNALLEDCQECFGTGCGYTRVGFFTYLLSVVSV